MTLLYHGWHSVHTISKDSNEFGLEQVAVKSLDPSRTPLYFLFHGNHISLINAFPIFTTVAIFTDPLHLTPSLSSQEVLSLLGFLLRRMSLNRAKNTNVETQSVNTLFLGSLEERGDVRPGWRKTRQARCQRLSILNDGSAGDARANRSELKSWSVSASRF